MDRRRFRLVEDLIVLGQIDIQVREVAEFVKIDYALIAHADLIECFFLSTADIVLNGAVVVFGADAAELRYWDRVLRSELGRVKEVVLERDHDPEVKSRIQPLLHPSQINSKNRQCELKE